MAKRKQQEEPQGPGISGLFNVPPTYYLPGTIGDVGAVAIDYPTMRAEPWNQTAAPIPTPSSPQGEIFAAPPGAVPASQFATGQQWKDLYDLMATETDVYRKYLKDTHDLGEFYFPPIVATNQVPSNLGDASAWYDTQKKKVFVPLYSGGYDAGDYMSVGPTVRQLAAGASEEFIPVVTSARNPKMSIRMDMSPIPHEIGHYYDFTGAPTKDESQMSWSYYDSSGLNPWDYILRNMASTIRPEETSRGKQGWFLGGEFSPSEVDVPAEMYAEYFRKALQAGVGLDIDRLRAMYGDNPPVSVQPIGPVIKPANLTPEQSARRQEEIDKAYQSAATGADAISEAARKSPQAELRQRLPDISRAVKELSKNAPSMATQRAMQPALTEEAKQFLYWLFTRGYTPR